MINIMILMQAVGVYIPHSITYVGFHKCKIEVLTWTFELLVLEDIPSSFLYFSRIINTHTSDAGISDESGEECKTGC